MILLWNNINIKLNKNPTHDQLNNLLNLYQTGNLTKAEKIALKITQDFPNHTFAWKILIQPSLLIQ